MRVKQSGAVVREVLAEAGDSVLVNGDIYMDLVRHIVLVKGKKCYFTPREYELLRYFMINRSKMLTHRQILKSVWGSAHVEDMQYLRVYISQLRNKIEPRPYKPDYIVTQHGIGYMMESVDSYPEPALQVINS